MSTPLYNSGPSSAAPNPMPMNGGEMSVIPASVQAGPRAGSIDSQTPLSQLATMAAVNRAGIPVASEQALAGPFTGYIQGMKVLPGVYSQMAARQNTTEASVMNSIAVATTLESKMSSLASSERFFYITLEYALNRGGQHQFTLDKVPTAEFSKALALASGGILSTRDLVESINGANLGYTTSHAQVTNGRLDPTGLTLRTKRS